MKIATFAPHLAGRMLPGIFDYLGIGKVERFPGDPAAHREPWAAWFWMHTTECGSPNHIGSWSDRQMGAYRFVPAHRWTLPEADWISMQAPPRDHLTSPKPVVGDDRPGVGPMGARQPADAGPQGELFAEVAA
jgi:hypothetical protein